MTNHGNKLIILEIYGLNEALKGSVACKECSGGPEILVEDHTRKEGLSTHPLLRCEQCGATNNIPFSTFATFTQGVNDQPQISVS